MEVKEELGEVREKFSGKMLGYYEVPSEKGFKEAVFQVGYSIDAWEKCVPMILLSIAGNCFAYSKKLRLLDVCFPEELVREFQGPKFGIGGVRQMLSVERRPLILHIIKPKMGMTAEQIAEHIQSGRWRDKAGAYAIQEGDDEFVEKIEGSLTNVMGLPMELLQRLLKKFII